MQKEKVTQCPLCMSDPVFHADFETCEGEGGTIFYLICRRCGLVFQSPRPTQAALEAFYRASYRQMIQGREEPIEKDLRVQHGRASHFLEFADGALPKVDRCLDIGSSTGIVLKRFHEAYDCDVLGVEPGDAYREYSQRNGVAAVAALEEIEAALRGSFDLVILSHTLEHLPDPVAYLRSIREQWFSPKGFLLVEVPNLFGHQALELSHLTAFTPDALKRVLHRAGYGILLLRIHGRPRSMLIPLYITALARAWVNEEKHCCMHSRIGWIRIRRKLALFWRKVTTRHAAKWAWLPWPKMR